jgi:hypothetical protein
MGLLVMLALAPRRVQEDVTPRATDLLRARKLADQTEQRLQLPALESPGWLHGGRGWDDDRSGATRTRARAKRK